MKLFKYLVSELVHNKKFVLFFIFNLCIGLTGFIALDGFKSSIDSTMKERSKAVLGADLSLSARRPIKDSEENFVKTDLPEGTTQASMVEMYSMVATESDLAKLVKVKATSPDYPFYGGLRFKNDTKTTSSFKALQDSNTEVWIYQELADQLEVRVGDTLKIGEKSFVVRQLIADDSTAGMGASFAPTIYLSLANLKSTGLITVGTVAWHSRLFKLPESESINVESLKEGIFSKLESQDLRVRSHVDASENMSQLLQRLNDYLGLAAVVALFLAAVGTGFLFRAYFQKKMSEVAILISLGMRRRDAIFYYLAQLSLLGAISALGALALSFLVIPIIQQVTVSLLPQEFSYMLTWQTAVVGLTVGVVGSFFICLPFLAQVRYLSPSVLLQEFRADAVGNWKSTLLLSLPAVGLFWGLSVWQANSIQTASIFVGAFFLAGVILVGCSYFLLKLLDKIRWNTKSLSLNWALRDLARDKMTSISCFLALGLGAVLLNLIPQVEASLEQELQSPESSRLPSLFMFDVQEDQVDILKDVLQKNNQTLTQVSPMIRSRLIKVNGEDFDKGKGAGQGMSREEEREMRFRNRGFNLSYKEGLSESETLFQGLEIEGAFDPENDEYAKISMEKRFADRLGFTIGDVLTFDIEGIPITGQVYNLRSVKWTSFQPNFFVQFQPGVLEMAPKTFIATTSGMSERQKSKIQKDIVKQAPNVSIIDVSRLIEKLSSLIQQMSLALQAMAVLCLLAGFVVIFSIVNHQMEKQRWQIGLKKVLGASFTEVRNHLLLQYTIIVFFAAQLGVAVSVLFSYFLSMLLFESVWVFDPWTPVFSVIAIMTTTVVIVLLSSRRYLREEPKILLID